MSQESPHDYLEQRMRERQQKADAMRAAGHNPYANDFRPDTTAAELREGYKGTRPAEAHKQIATVDEQVYRVAGRVLAKRGFKKSTFAPIDDGSGTIQLYLAADRCPDYERLVEWLDVGDIVGAEGGVFWTKTGELSILVTRFVILTKAVRPLPEKWHGLTDVDQRYRQRYVDMIATEGVRDTFRKRSQLVRGLRRFLDERGFVEVETPMMHTVIGGAAAQPFRTHHNALDLDLYLRIAPELFLKRLVVGGIPRVYEIGRNFRNEGLSRQHNPEFTMLEFYQAYATYQDLMRLTEELVVAVARDVTGGTTVEQEGNTIELAPPWRRISVKDAVVSIAGKSAEVFEDPETAARVAREVGVNPDDVTRAEAEARTAGATVETRREVAGRLGMAIFEATAEKTLIQPTFLTDFPLAVSPLARRKDDERAFCDRFELYIGGREIANAFSELNDPVDQRGRFEAQLAARQAGAAETMDYDEDYCRALEIGMPPTAGEGIGVDRLAMLLTGQTSIRDVILFPLMRPETAP
jgi:lysyl-tRNA synthetase, class II